jgi:ubiquitin-protein ligase
MNVRVKRFEKEKHLVPTIEVNNNFENMNITPTISITLPTHYPFHPPILKIQSVSYNYYLEKGFRVFRPFIDQYKINPGYNCCLCCSSITGKWAPTYGLDDVITEYKKYDSSLRTISTAKLVLTNLNMDELINSTILSFIILLY